MSYPESPDQTGKAPEHRDAALRAQAKGACNTPMRKVEAKELESPESIVRDYFDAEKEIKVIWNAHEKEKKHLTDEKRDKSWEITNRIRDLQSEQHRLEDSYDDKIKESTEKARELDKIQKEISNKT